MRLTALAACLALAACATHDVPTRPSDSRTTQVTQAVTSPLSDLNLVNAPVPPILAAATGDPYAVPADTSCPTLARLVQELDAVLGADLDREPDANDPRLVARGRQAAGDAAVRAVRSAAEGAVPYRGWVRKLSGAERYSERVEAAIAAGTVRRSYLKGIGQARSCAAPAAPLRR